MEVTKNGQVNSVISEEMTETVRNNLTIINDGEKYIIRKVEKVNKNPVFLFVKRLFDILISLIGIIVLAVPMIIISVIVKADSSGHAVYAQKRLGRDGKEFSILKFRSMVKDAEKDGAVWASRDDDRVTKVGAVLRKTHLDELPQLFNILKGDMSFVGPRPERDVFYKSFSEYIDGFDQRLLVKHGLTGWAQINGGYELTPMEKCAWDIDYIEKQSFLIDLKCVLKTATIIFGDDQAR